MACDYLAIQESAIASERSFFSGRRIDTMAYNSLALETFETLQILKDSYKSGLMSAREEATLHEFKQWNM